MLIVEVAAERLLSFRWHPYAVDPEMDYSEEPATLVEFRLDRDSTMSRGRAKSKLFA